MALTDTHCHLDVDLFDADRESVIERAIAADVSRMLVPALHLDSARRCLALTQTHARLFAAVGFHPTEIHEFKAVDLRALEALAADDKVVAIGEIGLDYYWVSDASRRRQQQDALRAQLVLAASTALPAVLHMREHEDADDGSCADDMLAILDEWVQFLKSRGSPLVGRCGVLHSFAGTPETAHAVIDLGFYVGVTGPITYPRARNRQELVAGLPLDRLLIETDAPFLAPQQHRGRRNEPAYVVHIADRIAEIQSRTRSEVAQATSSNAARLFAWGEPD